MYPSVDFYLKQYQSRENSRKNKQKGFGDSKKLIFGNIYKGERFPPHHINTQSGEGLGTVLANIARGVGRIISNPPGWLKEGAKIIGTSGLKAIGEYAGDIQAGADKTESRKRAFKSAVGNAMEEGARRIRGRGVGGRIKKRKCCRKLTLKSLKGKGGRRRKVKSNKKQIGGRKRRVRVNKKRKVRKQRKSIKRRTKFDLFSV